MSHSCVCHGSFIRVTWLNTWRCCLIVCLHRCVVRDVTHVCRDSFVCGTWISHVCAMAHSRVWGMTQVYRGFVWVIDVCAFAHSYVWHDSLLGDVVWLCACRGVLCGTWLIYAVAQLYESLMCVPWLIRMCDMNDYLEMLFDPMVAEACGVGHDSFIPWLMRKIPSCLYHGSFVCVWDVTHVCCDSFVWNINVWAMAHSYVWYD